MWVLSAASFSDSATILLDDRIEVLVDVYLDDTDFFVRQYGHDFPDLIVRELLLQVRHNILNRNSAGRKLRSAAAFHNCRSIHFSRLYRNKTVHALFYRTLSSVPRAARTALRGNQVLAAMLTRNRCPLIPPPSFPRRRESSEGIRPANWIPACAGMTNSQKRRITPPSA
jgi:hypothetical protein